MAEPENPIHITTANINLADQQRQWANQFRPGVFGPDTTRNRIKAGDIGLPSAGDETESESDTDEDQHAQKERKLLASKLPPVLRPAADWDPELVQRAALDQHLIDLDMAMHLRITEPDVRGPMTPPPPPAPWMSKLPTTPPPSRSATPPPQMLPPRPVRRVPPLVLPTRKPVCARELFPPEDIRTDEGIEGQGGARPIFPSQSAGWGSRLRQKRGRDN
jgi:hypothetical protein